VSNHSQTILKYDILFAGVKSALKTFLILCYDIDKYKNLVKI